MWIFLGCALAARQWERVWQRAPERGPGARAGSSLAADGRVAAAPSGRAPRAKPIRQWRLRAEAQFWTELREGQREAEQHCSRLHHD